MAYSPGQPVAAAARYDGQRNGIGGVPPVLPLEHAVDDLVAEAVPADGDDAPPLLPVVRVQEAAADQVAGVVRPAGHVQVVGYLGKELF